jgi:hypothetical protein
MNDKSLVGVDRDLFRKRTSQKDINGGRSLQMSTRWRCPQDGGKSTSWSHDFFQNPLLFVTMITGIYFYEPTYHWIKKNRLRGATNQLDKKCDKTSG